MEANDFVKIDNILADVWLIIDDEGLAKGLTKGKYISWIQNAMEELSFDTFWQKLTRDFDFPKDTLAFPLPPDCFNIREIYLFNNTCCKPETSALVHWKRLYNNRGKGEGYTAKRKENGVAETDQFFGNLFNFPLETTSLRSTHYFNIQNGLIMFSSNSNGFNKFRIVYNGMGGEIGDAPIIPRFFRKAVTDFVLERFFLAMKAREPRRFRTSWIDAKNDLSVSWAKAEIRVKNMDKVKRESLYEYLEDPLHK